MKNYVSQKDSKFLCNFSQIQQNQINAFNYFEKFFVDFDIEKDFLNYSTFLPFLRILIYKEEVFLCVFEGQLTPSVEELQRNTFQKKVEKIKFILANLFRFIDGRIIQKLLSKNVFDFLLQIIQLKLPNTNQPINFQSYNDFKNKIFSITKHFDYQVSFEFELILKLQYVLQNLLIDYLPIKYINIYLDHLKQKQKRFMRSVLKNKNNFRFILKQIYSGDSNMLQFLVQILFENIKSKKIAQQIVRYFDQYNFIKFISKLFQQFNFVKLGNFINKQSNKNWFNQDQNLNNIILVIKYYFYFSSSQTINDFVETISNNKFTNLQTVFLLYVQDENKIIQENCLDILLSILQKYLLVDEEFTKSKLIVEQIQQLIEIFDLKYNKRMLNFFECLTKLKQKNLLSEMSKIFLNDDFILEQLNSPSKQKVLHTIKIFNYFYQQYQKFGKLDLRFCRILQKLNSLQKKHQRKKNLIYSSIESVLKQIKIQNQQKSTQLINQRIIKLYF